MTGTASSRIYTLALQLTAPTQSPIACLRETPLVRLYQSPPRVPHRCAFRPIRMPIRRFARTMAFSYTIAIAQIAIAHRHF
jgi:hypothetical protein